MQIRDQIAHLMPGPDRLEAVEEGYVFPEIREEPESRGDSKVSDAEEDDSEDGHEKEKSEEAEESPRQVVDTLAKL